MEVGKQAGNLSTFLYGNECAGPAAPRKAPWDHIIQWKSIQHVLAFRVIVWELASSWKLD